MLEHWVFFDAECVRKREEIDYNSLKHGLLSIKVCHLHYWEDYIWFLTISPSNFHLLVIKPNKFGSIWKSITFNPGVKMLTSKPQSAH